MAKSNIALVHVYILHLTNMYTCKSILKTRTAFPEAKNVLQNKEMHFQPAVFVAAWEK